jgi:hypothetical protein
MKQKRNEKKLRFSRLTVANLEILKKGEQEDVKGGSYIDPALATVVPIFCGP